MGGIFSRSNRPSLPGAYFNFEADEVSSVPSAPGAAVAIPFTHDWGPEQTIVRLSSFAEFVAIYGASDDTPGYRAVKQAFIGEGVDGRGGAGEVVAYRQVGAAGAKATRVLNNTSAAAAITLSARYKGERGNDLRVTTQNNAVDSANTDLIILDGTVVVETFTFADTNITALATDINANSDWVTAGSVTSGTALAIVSGSAFASGDDGSTVLAIDWTDALDALDTQPFAAFCAYGLSDSEDNETVYLAIRTSIAAWTDAQNEAGKRFFTVFGGHSDDDITLAVARSNAFSSENIINLGVGTITDSTLGTGGTAQVLSTAEFAARVAGALVARGDSLSLTYSRFAGVELTTGPTTAELLTAFDGGVVALSRDSHTRAPVHLAVGLTTWTEADATADPSKPYLIYRQPKFVKTIHTLEGELTNWAEENIIGLQSVNDGTRQAVVGEVKARLAEREALGSIQTGWTVGIDQNPPPTDADEFIALAINVTFARSLEQVYFTISVG